MHPYRSLFKLASKSAFARIASPLLGLLLALAVLPAGSVKAAENSRPWRLSLTSGSNVFVPFYGGSLGYRLAELPQLEAGVSFSFNPSSLSSVYALGAYGKWMFLPGNLSPFASLDLGLAYQHQTAALDVPLSPLAAPWAMVGAGVEWMILPGFGMNAAIKTGYMMAHGILPGIDIRPELSVSYAF